MVTDLPFRSPEDRLDRDRGLDLENRLPQVGICHPQSQPGWVSSRTPSSLGASCRECLGISTLRTPSRTWYPLRWSVQRTTVRMHDTLLAPCCSWSLDRRACRPGLHRAGGLSGLCQGGRSGRFLNPDQCSSQQDKRCRRSPCQRLPGHRDGSRRPPHPWRWWYWWSRSSRRHWYTFCPGNKEMKGERAEAWETSSNWVLWK